MYESHMADHQSARANLPDPLSGFGRLNVVAWALPATMLSSASIAVLLIVLAFLQRSHEMRSLFILPFASSWLALPAAALAWLVAVCCRGRPGRNFPRYWSLGLAMLTTLVAVVCLTDLAKPVLRVSFQHALAVACLAAVLVLLPRLVRVRPDSSLVQRLAPASLLLVLVIVLPAAYFTGQQVVTSQGERIDRRLSQLQQWKADVREITAYDWSSMAQDPEGAAGRVKRLESLSFEGVMKAPGLWEAAAALDREEELKQEYMELVGALVEGADEARAPKLSDLKPSDPGFPTLKGLPGEYHRHLGRLFLELEAASSKDGPAALAELSPRVEEQRKKFQDRLKALAKSLPGVAVVDEVPKEIVPEEVREMGLADLLALPLASTSSGDLPPAADLPKLMSLTLSAGEPLARGVSNCTATGRYLLEANGDREYLHLQCSAYSAHEGDPEAEVRLEVQVLYESERFTKLTAGAAPASVLYRFPVEEGASAAGFRGEVVRDLETAFKKFGVSGLGTAAGSLQTGNGGTFPFEWRNGKETVELEVQRAPRG